MAYKESRLAEDEIYLNLTEHKYKTFLRVIIDNILTWHNKVKKK